MILGSRLYFLFFLSFGYTLCFAEDKIITSPLINLEKIKPSFEEIEETNNENTSKELIKNKKKTIQNTKVSSAKLKFLCHHID